jgi:beta-lactamase regulating signal transducer with metallopeptidase domain
MRITVLPIFPDRPTNPSRVDVHTGEIEINRARWNELSDSEKEFVLLHETGHYKEHTFDEVKADQYALRQLALKKPYSLRNYLNAVNEISYGNALRVNQAKYDVLRIAADNGSREAKELLERYSMAAADGSFQGCNNYTLYIAIAVLLLAIIYVIKIIKNG